MSTKYPDLFEGLAAPFHPREIRVRSQGARQFQYITARTAMNRLDSILGPENWWDDYEHRGHTVICRLTLHLPGGERVTKSDAGGHAGLQDAGDDEKSAISDAFKRACTKFGIGRYLHGDGVPAFERRPAPPPSPSPPAPPPSPPPRAAPSLEALAAAATPEEIEAFWAWARGFIESEGRRLSRLAADPQSGGLPPDWSSPANAFRLLNHMANWLHERGISSGDGRSTEDNRAKAAAAAWARARHRQAFDEEMRRWQAKLSAEAAAPRDRPPHDPGGSAE